MNTNISTDNLVKRFKIFKEGVTSQPVWIMSLKNQPYDLERKICFYRTIGYTVSNIQRKESVFGSSSNFGYTDMQETLRDLFNRY